MNWIELPEQPVEIAIALTIFCSACHAIKPIFGRYDKWLVLFFGCIHGLAFGSVLTELHLETGQLLLSMLGYNLGIEVMQIVIIGCVFPCFIIVSRNKHDSPFRIAGAVACILAALAWTQERITGLSNPISRMMECTGTHLRWLLLLPITAAIASIIIRNYSSKRH